VIHFLFGSFFGLAVFLLHQTDQLLAVALGLFQLVIGQLAPFLAGFAFPFFPVSFYGIPVHGRSPFVLRSLGNERRTFRIVPSRQACGARPSERPPPMTHHAALMLTAGFGIPVLAALNSGLGKHLGAPAAASVILFVVAISVALLVTLVSHQGGAISFGAPKHLYLGGLFVAFYVLSITWVAPVFGVGNAVFFVLLGQLASAAVIDHWGLFGAVHTPLTALRGAGIVVMAIGVALTQLSPKV
jgi:transporter family-2 protein